MHDKSVLITGSGGVVGSAMTQRANEGGRFDRVDCISSRSDCNLEDFAETRAVIGYLKPKIVIHLAAAVFGVGGNLKFPGEAFRRNIQINTNVIEACRLAHVEKIV